MFKEKFNEEMQNILPSEDTKNAILAKIRAEQANFVAVPPKKSVKNRWVASIAAALALVIVSVSVFGLPHFNADDYVINSSPDTKEDSFSQDLASKESSEPKNPSSNVSDQTSNENKAPSKYAPQSTTYDAVYKLYEEIDAIQTAQNEHSFYENTDSIVLGGSNKGPSSNSSNSVSTAPAKNYTETNLQVEGVEEGDIVKTDGKYIYTLGSSDDEIYIIKATNGKLSKMAHIEIEDTPSYKLYDDYPDIKELYIWGDTLVAIVSARRKSKSYKGMCTVAMLFDVSNHKAPKCVKEYVQTGVYEASRIIGNKLYIFSNGNTYRNEETKNPDGSYETKKVWYLPQFGVDNKILKFIEEKDLYVFDGEVKAEYFSVASIDLNNREVIDKKSVIGGSDNVYVNNNSIYAVSGEINYFKDEKEYKPKTYIMKFAINNGKIIPLAKASVKGSLHNQFLMDEYDGYFRIITTTRRYEKICSCGFRRTVGVESNDVYVFDKNLKMVGSVNGIAKDEAVTSSRFMGEIGYFCTSPLNANTDPFFAVDFSNPKKPKIIDSLEFPGVVDYLHPYGDNMMLGIGETENSDKVKLIMFDVSNPKKIKQLFALDTNVPYGNLDFDWRDGHKQVNILNEKNIICFPGGTKYNMFTFSKKKGFAAHKENLFATQTNRWGETMDDYNSYQIRGIFIDDYLYVCNYFGIISYAPFDDGRKIKGIRFE